MSKVIKPLHSQTNKPSSEPSFFPVYSWNTTVSICIISPYPGFIGSFYWFERNILFHNTMPFKFYQLFINGLYIFLLVCIHERFIQSLWSLYRTAHRGTTLCYHCNVNIAKLKKKTLPGIIFVTQLRKSTPIAKNPC